MFLYEPLASIPGVDPEDGLNLNEVPITRKFIESMESTCEYADVKAKRSRTYHFCVPPIASASVAPQER